MYEVVFPSNSLGMVPSTQVFFIFISSLSSSTRKNSCTSCCMNESSVSQPKDLVSFFVPTDLSMDCRSWNTLCNANPTLLALSSASVGILYTALRNAFVK